MRPQSLFVKVTVIFWLLSSNCWASPVEELGTLVEMVPKQQASTSPFGDYGFVAIVLQQTDENNIKPTFVAHSATDFVRLFRRLPVELQEYGIWLSLAEGDPYSAHEKIMLEKLESLCKRHRLWLFTRIGHDDRAWNQVSSPPASKDPPCQQLRGQRLAGQNYERLSPMEKQLIGTWTSPMITSSYEGENGVSVETRESKEVMEITFTTDHTEFWCPNGGASQNSAHWRLEGSVLVLTFEKQSRDQDFTKERRETIAKLTATELVFTDGTVEGRWKRVR